MKLEIKKKHIDEANRARRSGGLSAYIPRICAVAQALIGLGYEEVRVFTFGITLAKGHHWVVLGHSWMMDWDDGQPVYPVTLELEEAA